MGTQPLGSETNPQRYSSSTTASFNGDRFDWARSTPKALGAFGAGVLTATNPNPAPPTPPPPAYQLAQSMPADALVIAPLSQFKEIEERLSLLEHNQRMLFALAGSVDDLAPAAPGAVYTQAFVSSDDPFVLADKLDFAVDADLAIDAHLVAIARENVGADVPRVRAAAARYLALFAPEMADILIERLAIEKEPSVRMTLEAAVELAAA